VGRNEPIRDSISRECLLYLRSYWLVPAHQDFRHTGRDVTQLSNIHPAVVPRFHKYLVRHLTQDPSTKGLHRPTFYLFPSIHEERGRPNSTAVRYPPHSRPNIRKLQNTIGCLTLSVAFTMPAIDTRWSHRVGSPALTVPPFDTVGAQTTLEWKDVEFRSEVT
jgi:hypothetical protein